MNFQANPLYCVCVCRWIMSQVSSGRETWDTRISETEYNDTHVHTHTHIRMHLAHWRINIKVPRTEHVSNLNLRLGRISGKSLNCNTIYSQTDITKSQTKTHSLECVCVHLILYTPFFSIFRDSIQFGVFFVFFRRKSIPSIYTILYIRSLIHCNMSEIIKNK